MAGKIIFGVNAVREALQTGRHVNRVYLAKESRTPGAEEVLDLARTAKVLFDFVPQAKLNALTHTREHQGVAAAVSPVDYVTLKDLVATLPPVCCLLALDQVQHPKNLGMIIRTAAAAGAQGLIAPMRGGALLDDDVVRASAGLVMRLPMVACANLTQALRDLRAADFWSFSLEAGAPQSVFTKDWPARVVLVAGNETDGVRPVTRKACDDAVSIPLAAGVDSLNVAVATGIALFQVVHAHRAG